MFPAFYKQWEGREESVGVCYLKELTSGKWSLGESRVREKVVQGKQEMHEIRR